MESMKFIQNEIRNRNMMIPVSIFNKSNSEKLLL